MVREGLSHTDTASSTRTLHSSPGVACHHLLGPASSGGSGRRTASGMVCSQGAASRELSMAAQVGRLRGSLLSMA